MIKVLTKNIGSAPMFDPNFDPDAEEPIDKLLKFQKIGFNPMFILYVSTNPKNPQLYSLSVSASIK